MIFTGRSSEFARTCRVIRRGSDAKVVVSHAECAHGAHD